MPVVLSPALRDQDEKAETITTTQTYPFYLVGTGFASGVELKVGDRMASRPGRWLVVLGVTWHSRPEGYRDRLPGMSAERGFSSGYERAFSARLVDPLSSTNGRIVRAVNCWAIATLDEFDAERPNESGGCEYVELLFEGARLELTWGFDPMLRDGGLCFHIQAESRVSGGRHVDRIVVDASRTSLWHAVIGRPFSGPRVMGVGRCPQAIEFITSAWPHASRAVSIGYAKPDGPWLGDGDDLLVLDGACAVLPREWAVLWESIQPSHVP